ARYTHRVALSNDRLLRLEDDRVHFQYKDYSDASQSKTTSLEAPEFIRRYLLHVLPPGFHRIRYYGRSPIAGGPPTWSAAVRYSAPSLPKPSGRPTAPVTRSQSPGSSSSAASPGSTRPSAPSARPVGSSISRRLSAGPRPSAEPHRRHDLSALWTTARAVADRAATAVHGIPIPSGVRSMVRSPRKATSTMTGRAHKRREN
ncbi:MAG: hypothetical protein GY856_25690, partial [bacterium]|nr:hypothetical protein [bacterium]